MRNYFTTQHIENRLNAYCESSCTRTEDSTSINFEGYDFEGDIVQISLTEVDGIRYIEVGIDGNLLTEAQIIALLEG